ncbi:MAG: Uma2 family endonuclease [Thermoguttaceae bacterium]
MAVLITDPRLEDQFIEERKLHGSDRWDEVWEGVYIVTPLPNNEHQEIVSDLIYLFNEIVVRGGLGKVFPGVNLSDVNGEWKDDFRGPDVAVFLKTGKAIDRGTHWCGAADFLVEIISSGDRTREKIPFYNRIGVVELLVIDREPWALELYQRRDSRLQLAAKSTLEKSEILSSVALPISFQLVPGQPRPQIAVAQIDGKGQWII